MFLIFASLAFASVAAGDYAPLKGQYTVRGKTFYDPPPGEPQDTHVYFVLEGDSAKDLYGAMKVKAGRDVCINDGSVTKRIDGMQCTLSAGGKEYRCWFGIDVKHQKITNGVVC